MIKINNFEEMARAPLPEGVNPLVRHELQTLLELSGGQTIDNEYGHVLVLEEGDTDVSDVKLYVDGVEETSYSAVSPEPINTTSSADVKIGVFIGHDRYFTGRIDDVRIYNYPISSLNIASIYADFANDSACYDFDIPLDFDGNCRVDINDFVVMSEEWLLCGIVPICLSDMP